MKSQIKKIVCLIACLCLVFSCFMVVSAAEADATITFNNTSKRTEYSTSKQVWVENGITVTNNKSTSTSNVGDYSNPARFYKNSEVIIAFGSPMTKIEINANSSSYATDLVDSLTNPQGTVTKSDKKVTIVPTTPVTSYTFKCSDGQVRVDSIKVYYDDGQAGGGSNPNPDPVEPPFDPSTATPAEIIDKAYELTGSETIENVTLTGKITAIGDKYNAEFKNITFTIAIEGVEKTLYCYRVTADTAKLETLAGLAVDDTVTLNGTIGVYNNNPQFLAGTKMTECVKGVAPEAPEDPKEIVDAAFALEAGGALPYEATLTGKVVSIDTEYSEQHQNITVTIEVEGTTGKKNIQCYRLKAGEGADASAIAVGDTITVTGFIINYAASNKVQFNANATFVPYVEDNNDNDDNNNNNNNNNNDNTNTDDDKSDATETGDVAMTLTVATLVVAVAAAVVVVRKRQDN